MPTSNDSESYVDFDEITGSIIFGAGEDYNERDFHSSELTREQTVELYKQMKAYFEKQKLN